MVRMIPEWYWGSVLTYYKSNCKISPRYLILLIYDYFEQVKQVNQYMMEESHALSFHMTWGVEIVLQEVWF